MDKFLEQFSDPQDTDLMELYYVFGSKNIKNFLVSSTKKETNTSPLAFSCLKSKMGISEQCENIVQSKE